MAACGAVAKANCATGFRESSWTRNPHGSAIGGSDLQMRLPVVEGEFPIRASNVYRRSGRRLAMAVSRTARSHVRTMTSDAVAGS